MFVAHEKAHDGNARYKRWKQISSRTTRHKYLSSLQSGRAVHRTLFHLVFCSIAALLMLLFHAYTSNTDSGLCMNATGCGNGRCSLESPKSLSAIVPYARSVWPAAGSITEATCRARMFLRAQIPPMSLRQCADEQDNCLLFWARWAK